MDKQSPIQSKEAIKMEQLRRNITKRMNDKWKKALKHLNINENLLSMKDELS